MSYPTVVTTPAANSSDQAIQQALTGGSAGGVPAVPGYTSATTGAGTTVSGEPITNSANAIDVGGVTLQLNESPSTRVQIGSPLAGFNAPAAQPSEGELARALTGLSPQNEPGVTQAQPQMTTISALMNSFYSSLNNTTFKDQFAEQAYSAGLISTPNASESELLVAYQAVVEQAATSGASWTSVLQQAASVGWANIQPNKETADYGLSGTGNQGDAPDTSNSTTSTSYVSYMDPATAQGTLADSYYRLLGRLPTTAEYQSFLNSLYTYQNNENTGEYNSTTKGTTGSAKGTSGGDGQGVDTTTTTNEIKQEGVGTRGAEFLAAQQAMDDPNYGAYQAATTYFHAFMSALGGPGAGLTGSGPEVTAP